MKTIAFFNNKGGVGKTSLAYHLSWMLSELGTTVVAADLDPQANLTAMFLPEDRLEELWPAGEHPDTIYGAVSPIVRGLGDVREPHIEQVDDRIGLLAGDLALSRFEARLSAAWPDCLDRREAAFRTASSFHRMVQSAGEKFDAGLGIIDVGPYLGEINRSALLAADYVVIPLAADLFSLQGLRNLGPTLAEWRDEWNDRLNRKPVGMDLNLPEGNMQPLGYVVLQHAIRLDRPVKAYKRWMDRIPRTYAEEVLQGSVRDDLTVAADPHCLASLKNYRSLMPLSQDALKPMFMLKPADGALGGHMNAVRDCYEHFRQLALTIVERLGADVVD